MKILKKRIKLQKILVFLELYSQYFFLFNRYLLCSVYDCLGSKKAYSFRLLGTNKDEVHLFESAVDLLSFATLYKLNGGNWKELNLISLSGVYAPSSDLTKSKVPKALQKYLENNLSLKRIVLHLDNDIAGRRATKVLEFALSNQLEVVDDPPRYGKDVNDFLCFKLNIKSIKERNYEI